MKLLLVLSVTLRADKIANSEWICHCLNKAYLHTRVCHFVHDDNLNMHRVIHYSFSETITASYGQVSAQTISLQPCTSSWTYREGNQIHFCVSRNVKLEVILFIFHLEIVPETVYNFD